jgi:NADH:ubiquinone oxidoreductase subunit 3 (subunit A)
MIKKQQKWIALLVICTFVWLMQVSTMPAAAAGTSEQVSSAGVEQGPDYYESVSHKTAPTKKKSPLPFILIGVGLVTVTVAVLFLFVLKGYDIRGSWTVRFTWIGDPTGTGTITFTGDKKTGTFMTSDGSGGGTYVVDGKKVVFSFPSGGAVYTGTFSDKDNMSGTMVGGSDSGTWSATKNSGATSANYPMTARAEGTMNHAGKRLQ